MQRMPLNRVLDGEVVQAASYLVLEPVPRAASQARRFVAEHIPDLPEDVEDALQLLTSELVTNAVIHARTALEVGVAVSSSAVLITVHDLDLKMPLQEPYAEREGGWGLGLVAAMAHSWSTFRHAEGGKTMWFRLQRVPGQRAVDGSAARAAADGAGPISRDGAHYDGLAPLDGLPSGDGLAPHDGAASPGGGAASPGWSQP